MRSNSGERAHLTQSSKDLNEFFEQFVTGWDHTRLTCYDERVIE